MELKETIHSVFNQFCTENSFKDFNTFSSGHINNTYLIITDKKPFYVLQKINGNVFTKAKEVIENKVKIAKHLTTKAIKTITYLTTKNNLNYYLDSNGNYWNLSLFIENSETHIKVDSSKIALEAGKATGFFLNDVHDFKGTLVDILPKFHNMTFRFSQFDEALKKASTNRKKLAQNWIDFANSNRNEMCVLDVAINKNKIPLRVTHNDTKISNILFDNNQNAICLIDLDTVMLGAIHFDFGDALRTICNTTNEDEKDISKVKFNFNYFKSYTQGFVETIKNSLTKNEIDFLPVSPKIITFIMGLRFLTDFLNNDIYYQTKYGNHNLDRAKNQFTLVKEMKLHQKEISLFISKQFS